ncbi:hypothetical protein [Kineococcus indalonis]|uniref:hypothetical protein n=1 Tax=Kineococcus indalonis TaxID=2696566 RepID=UPI0014133508|nr:hypothetical protein [Kineococcus indalonis]NAZ85916.1 hypothetical protein [Kineococcus indalonis]
MSTYDVTGGSGATAAGAGGTSGTGDAQGRAQETAGTAKEQAGQVAGTAKEQAGQVAGTAKEQAGQVAGTAKQQAAEVAGTAKQEAGHVVASAREQLSDVLGQAEAQAGDLLGELRKQVDEQTSTGRDKIAALLTQAGEELAQMGRASEGSGPATQLVRQAGDRVGAWGQTLSSHEPAELLEQLRTYARRRPGAFLLGALAAGLVAGRVTRGAKAAHDAGPSAQGRELEPLSTAPTPGTAPGAGTGTITDLRGSDLSSTYASGVTGMGTTTSPTTGPGAGRHVGTGTTDETVSRYGEDPNEDLLPHHIRSDVPSVSDAPSHGSRP